MALPKTFHGFVDTTMDALLIFEACRRGILPKISRRLQERERGTVQSGTIFVFDERESGIKRWTDGLSWSPSRILGNFLVYRETGNRVSSQQNDYNVTGPLEPESEPALVDQVDRCRERALVGSLTSSYKFKPHGLIKKTLSIVVNGSPLHLVSYYTKEDALHQVLPAPSSVPKLACLTIAPELVLRQSFRVPPLIDPSQPEPLTSAHALTTNVTGHRRQHSDILPDIQERRPRKLLKTGRSSVLCHVTADHNDGLECPWKSRCKDAVAETPPTHPPVVPSTAGTNGSYHLHRHQLQSTTRTSPGSSKSNYCVGKRQVDGPHWHDDGQPTSPMSFQFKHDRDDHPLTPLPTFVGYSCQSTPSPVRKHEFPPIRSTTPGFVLPDIPFSSSNRFVYSPNNPFTHAQR